MNACPIFIFSMENLGILLNPMGKEAPEDLSEEKRENLGYGE